MKRFLKFIGFTIVSIILVFAGFLGYMTMKDYRPDPVERIDIQGPGTETGPPADTLSLFTWNIGYGGLGAEQDFFFDGGKNVRPTHELNQKYVKGITQTVAGLDSVDFILLQEVDRGSKRSYKEDQVQTLANACKNYFYGFATNYNSLFVPQPMANPYGKCYGGIMTLSKYKPASASRFKLAQDAAWPTGLFMLKRCYMEFRYPLKNGKELVIINQHLSAYDDGTVKQQQMDTLKQKLLAEYKNGNYVIVGGDWNQYPPGYTVKLRKQDNVVEKTAEANYPEAGWKWVYDPATTTNRKLYEPFKKGQTDEVIIDYFLLSPNVNMLTIHGVDMNFANSDHQPVYLKVALAQ